jgi:hypothetical protein
VIGNENGLPESTLTNGGEVATPRRFRWKRWVIGSVVVLFLSAGTFVLWCAYEAISASLHAERGLHATRWTIQAAEDYVTKHNGAWPRSWVDLEESSSQMKDAYGITGGREHVEEFVAVDFKADPDRLAKQTEEQFTAIKPVGPLYPSYRSQIPFLLEALRKARGPQTDSSRPERARR